MTTNQEARTGTERMLLWGEDGAAYAIPLTALEGYRLAESQRAELGPRPHVEAGNVEGFATGLHGELVGTFGFGPMSRERFLALRVNHPRHDGGDYHPPLR